MMSFLFVSTTTSSVLVLFYLLALMLVFLFLLFLIFWTISRSLPLFLFPFRMITSISLSMSLWSIIRIRVTILRRITISIFFLRPFSFRLTYFNLFFLLITWFFLPFTLIRFWRMLTLMSFISKYFHSILIFLIQIIPNLFKNTVERIITSILILIIFDIHLSDKLYKRILCFSGCISINIHDKIFHEILSIMKILWGLVINKPWIMKFIKSTKIHRYLII